MKTQLVLLATVFLMTQVAGAQNTPPAGTNPPPGAPAGQPPMGQGQPNQMGQGQPNQGNPMQPPQGQPPQGQPTMGNQPQAKSKGPAWTPERCQKQIPKVKKGAENCLKIKKEAQRKACYDKMGDKFPREFWETCRAQIEPLKAEMEAKAKEKYPDQASGIGGDNDGQNNQPNQGSGPQNAPGPNNGPGASAQGPGPQGAPDTKGTQGKPVPKMDCTKVVSKIKKKTDSCLKIKVQAKRKVCFDKVGEEIEKTGAHDACGDALNQLKAEVQQLEAQKYPGEPPSIN